LDAANHITGQGVWNDRLWSDPSFAFDSWGGGGGYSTFFDRPVWQDGAVPEPARGVPDVAFYADLLPGYLIYCTNDPAECLPATGPFEAVGGTSAATPLFAGVLALLTQWTRAIDQPTPGFVTPLLYAVAHAAPPGVVRDVTAVNNIVFDDPSITCCTAGPGWDAASGWGSYDATALRAALEPPLVTLTSSRPAGVAPLAVVLSAEAVVAAGAPLRYAWDLDGDGVDDEITETNQLATPFPAPGVAQPRVTVTTTLGRRGSASAPVLVQRRPTFTG
ncbi:MAG TPA: S8 family serine peptidase, partial [Acidimicrobiia bacterium]